MGAISNFVAGLLPLTQDPGAGGFPLTPPFIIQEQTGDERSIVLHGRGLPYRDPGFELETEQDLEATKYPGSPVLSVQVMGSQEKETTLRGMWKDRFIGGTTDPTQAPIAVDGIAVTTVVDAEKLFYDVARKGQLLKVTWGPVLRLGFLQRFRRSFIHLQDMSWELTFKWISSGDPNVGMSAGVQLDQSSTLAGLNSAMSQLRTGINQVQGAIATAQDTVNGYLALIDKADSLVQQAGDAADAVVNLLDTPDVAAQKLASLYGAIAGSAQDLSDELQATPTTAMLLGSPSSPASTPVVTASAASLGAGTGGPTGGSTNAGVSGALVVASARPPSTMASFLQAASFKRSLLRAARAARYTATRAAAMTRAQSKAPEIIASFKAKQAMDLRKISALYYGTPDDWRGLGQFNGIKGTEVPVNTLINIPRALPPLGGTTQFGIPTLAPSSTTGS